MTNKFFPLIDDDFFSDDTRNNENDSDSKTSSLQYSNQENLSMNKTTNYICQNITLKVNQNKKNSASFSLNLINEQNRANHSHINNYTQNIILHSLNKIKNSNSLKYNENENVNDGIQHIILKSLKKNKEENSNKLNNDKNEKYNNNLIFNRNNIIRVIISNEKIIQNFPVEYLNEMICDLCINLYNDKYSSETIKSKQYQFFNNSLNFFEIRTSLFNFILQLTMNTSISEATLFLTYNIFDRYIFIQSENKNKDELFLIIITCFVLAIKYNETSVPNLEEICLICQNKFNKEQINKSELNIMEGLNYNISIPTIFDLFQFIKFIKNLAQKEYYLGVFILEMFIISGGSLKYNPLTIIEAIYLLILETIGKEKRNLNLYNYMNYSNINLNKYNEETDKCLLDIKDECIHVKEKNFSNLIKKFSTEKYQKISIDFQLL